MSEPGYIMTELEGCLRTVMIVGLVMMGLVMIGIGWVIWWLFG